MPIRLRITNDRPPPPSAKVLVSAFLLSSPPVYDGSRSHYLKADPDPLDNPRRVLTRMKVGDNVLFPVEADMLATFRARLSSASKLSQRGVVTQFETNPSAKGLRVWRIT